MYTSMLGALEQKVDDSKTLPYLIIYGWWLLVQNCATRRFSDLRRMRPQDVKVSVNVFTTILTGLNTQGADKRTQSPSQSSSVRVSAYRRTIGSLKDGQCLVNWPLSTESFSFHQ